MRGLGSGERVYQNRLNLWGNARIASVPRQTTTGETTIADFTIAGEAGKLKLNELAQSAEFQMGIEISPLLKKPLVFTQGNRKRMLGLIFFAGANGAFTQPDFSKAKALVVPGPNDNQSALFRKLHPEVGNAPNRRSRRGPGASRRGRWVRWDCPLRPAQGHGLRAGPGNGATSARGSDQPRGGLRSACATASPTSAVSDANRLTIVGLYPSLHSRRMLSRTSCQLGAPGNSRG